MTATYSFFQTAGCLLFLLSTPETGLVTVLFTSRICLYLHCHVVRGTKVFVWALNAPRSWITRAQNNILLGPVLCWSIWMPWISSVLLNLFLLAISEEWHIFLIHPPGLNIMSFFLFFFVCINNSSHLRGNNTFLMKITTALGKKATTFNLIQSYNLHVKSVSDHIKKNFFVAPNSSKGAKSFN